MTLTPHTAHPADRSYVLKLHRSADGAHLCGRLENLATGWKADFEGGDALLAALAADLLLHAPAPTEPHHEA
jgi:hypothetical protein